jgi:hypothetical protein
MPRFVGNLHEKGKPDSNLDSFSITSVNRELGVSELSRQALEEMKRRKIAVASLTMTQDDSGIGTIELESPKHAKGII